MRVGFRELQFKRSSLLFSLSLSPTSSPYSTPEIHSIWLSVSPRGLYHLSISLFYLLHSS